MQNAQKGFIVSALLAVVILLIAVFGLYVYQDKEVAVDQETAQTYRTPSDLAKSSGLEFVFSYPEGYTVKDGSWYTTPGGKTYPFARVFRTGEQKDESFVTVSTKTTVSTGPELVCDSAYVKCKELGESIVYTKSDNASVLRLFDTIVNSIEISQVQ